MSKVHFIKFSTIMYCLGIGIIILCITIGSMLFFTDKPAADEAVTADSADSRKELFSDDMLKYFINAASPTIEVLYKECGLLPEYDMKTSLVRYVADIDLNEPLSILKNQLPMLGMVDVKNASSAAGTEKQPAPIKQPDKPKPEADKAANDDNKEKINEINVDSDKPLVLIYHTHTREAYISKYKVDDVDRTLDPQNNMVRVGEGLKKHLENQGISVIHDETVYDVPYENSYGRSKMGIKKVLQKYPTIKYAFDVHRDAFAEVINKNTTQVPDPDKLPNKSFRRKYVMNCNGERVAKVMWVVGTRRTAGQKEDWHENLAFAQNLHKTLNQAAQGMSLNVETKPYGSYNQNLLPNSTLIEIGSNHNTLNEALNSTKYVADTIAKVIKENEKR